MCMLTSAPLVPVPEPARPRLETRAFPFLNLALQRCLACATGLHCAKV